MAITHHLLEVKGWKRSLVNRSLTIYYVDRDTMRSLTMDGLARDEQSRGFHDRNVTGERGVGDAQVLGDLTSADVALVLEVVEDLGAGGACASAACISSDTSGGPE